MQGWSALFFPRPCAPAAQTCELNRGRWEARSLIAFNTTATAVDFPFVEQGARLTRCIDSDRFPAQGVETEYLITSCAPQRMDFHHMLQTDRNHWGIEGRFHSRLDVGAGEDRSRVRNRVSALNLGMIRRAVVSLAAYWIKRCRNKRQATLSGFYDFMSASNAKKAFSLVTVCNPSWLPK